MIELSPIQPAPKPGIFSSRKEPDAYKEYQKRYDNMNKIIKIFDKYRREYIGFMSMTTITSTKIISALNYLGNILNDNDKSLKNNAYKAIQSKSGEIKSRLQLLNLKLNKEYIPNLNKSIEIFNGPGTKFSEKMENIKVNGGIVMMKNDIKDIDITGGGNRTRSKKNRSNNQTMKVRYI